MQEVKETEAKAVRVAAEVVGKVGIVLTAVIVAAVARVKKMAAKVEKGTVVVRAKVTARVKVTTRVKEMAKNMEKDTIGGGR